MAIFLTYVVLALAAPWIAPHDPYDQSSYDIMDAELPHRPGWRGG